MALGIDVLDADSYVNVVIVALLVGPIDGESQENTVVISGECRQNGRSFGRGLALAGVASGSRAFQTAAEFLL